MLLKAMIENFSVAQIDEFLIRSRVIESSAFGAIGTDLQEIETRSEGGRNLILFQASVQAGLQSALVNVIEKNQKLGLIPLAAEEDDAGENTREAIKEFIQTCSRQLFATIPIP